MLDTLYSSLFRPTPERVTPQAGIIIGLIIVLVLALNAGGAVGLGAGGVIGFTLGFLLAGLLGLFWLSAAVNLLAQLLGGQSGAQSGGRATLIAVTLGLWPLLLTGPAIAAAKWSATLGSLFSFVVTLGAFVTLTVAIRRVHHLSWIKAVLCLTITLILSGLALLGLIFWPLMIFLGT